MDDADHYLDIRDIVKLFWSGRYVISASAILLATVALLIALARPDVYTSEALLKPTEEGANAARSLGGISSLGVLAGLNLGDTGSRADLAIAVLESRKFLTTFAREHGIVPELIAAESWDKGSHQLAYDEDLYSSDSRKWVRKVELPLTPEPNDTEIYEAFREILQVERNQETGFVRFSLTFVSPVHASAWAQQLLADLNVEIRNQAIKELDRSIDYLREKLDETAVADVRSSLGQLLQHQIRDRMLAEAKAEYALETIDPAFVPDFKSGPPRILMVLAGGVLGGLLGVLAVLIYHGLRPPRRDAIATVDGNGSGQAGA